MVRRILANHYRSDPGGRGPSWLTFFGHMKDSLWGVDLFRCKSILLQSHWALWSWTSSRVASSDLVSMPAMWTGPPCAVCSTRLFRPSPRLATSVPITNRYSCASPGRPIFLSWRFGRSSPSSIMLSYTSSAGGVTVAGFTGCLKLRERHFAMPRRNLTLPIQVHQPYCHLSASR